MAIKVLGNLGSLSIKEAGLGWGLDEELKFQNTGEHLETQGKNHVVKIWYERLHATFYEADNTRLCDVKYSQ
ncbi:hypothetical protein CsSME_00018750 [Camellia sinensis var. sinensis]